jgi:arylsulfatase A-like enzyme
VSPPQPNILLITVDTLSADRLSCYGGPPDVGLAICELGEGGTRYRWAFSTSSWTVPSVASLLTSRYPGQHGVSQLRRSALGNQELTVAEASVSELLSRELSVSARGYCSKIIRSAIGSQGF